MALSAPKPRVQQTSTTTGTGTYSLDATIPDAYLGFVAEIGDTNTCHVLVTGSASNDWEWGTYTVGDATPDTIARTTVERSTNSNAAVNWGAGTRTLSVIWPPDVTEMLALLGVEASADVTDATNVLAGLVGQEAVATGFTGTLDGVLGGGTPAAATVTTIDASGVATATTFEPDGDTSASDNAAIGYTSAEGLILTGQGSTNDVTIKNDADAAVISVPTGTTNVTIAGDLTISGDDLTMGTNTSGAALIADGTNFNPVVISGDISINTSGVAAIGSGVIVEADIADNAVSLAKMAGGTDGNIISFDASGDPVAVATGNDGQVLTSSGAGAVCAFEDAGGGGAYVYINSATASDSANLTVTGLTTTYKTYLVVFEDIVPASDGPKGNFRIGDSGGIKDSDLYDYHLSELSSGSSSYGAQVAQDIGWGRVFANIGNASGEGGGGHLFLNGCAGAIFPVWSGSSGYWKKDQTVLGGVILGGYAAATVVTQVQLYMSTGNITSGRMSVFGIDPS